MKATASRKHKHQHKEGLSRQAHFVFALPQDVRYIHFSNQTFALA